MRADLSSISSSGLKMLEPYRHPITLVLSSKRDHYNRQYSVGLERQDDFSSPHISSLSQKTYPRIGTEAFLAAGETSW